MKKEYIAAYRWMFGGTKKDAEKAIKELTVERLNLILKAFYQNSKKSFMED